MKKTGVKKLIGAGLKIIIAGVVFAFLGLKSLDFFLFTTPADQWYLSWLGFGLTGGGVIAYLLIFMWDADTDLKKTVAIVMLAVCVIGELATAGFGMQVDTMKKTGIQMTEQDFQAMVFAVQILGFLHAAALIAYVAGDGIGNAFSDDDGDGIPNIIDNNSKSKLQPVPQPQPMKTNAAEVELAQLRAELEAMKAAAPKAEAGKPNQ